MVTCYCKNKIYISKCIFYVFINISHKRRIFLILIFRTETSVRLVFYLQMDSEGEELTLKTCNSSTGKDGFLKSAYNHNTRTHARTHTCMFHLPLWVRGNRFNNPTLELSIL